jgi:ubiquinone/menaquinone biosynthesis C-methylase UbiE
VIELQPDRATLAYHDFLRRAKGFWAREMYRSVHRDFLAESRRNGGQGFADVDAAEHALASQPRYQFFAALERNLQRLKYSGGRGIIAALDAQRVELEAALDAARREGEASGQLQLNPAMELPQYYRAVEFHQHPGGVWSDPLAGVAYDFGRRTTMPAHIDPDEIHRRFAASVPMRGARRILDVGCGTGRSTLPFAALHPAAELHGIDLSAPCLVRAWQRSHAAGIEVRWSQQAAEHTAYQDGYFDLIHSTFLLHELPRDALHRVASDMFRVLAPGGSFVSLDFHSPPGGVFGEFIHFGHARRNNEVFMRSFCETDFLRMLGDLGYRDAQMLPFDDGSGVFEAGDVPPAWRFPSQLFIATK